MNTQIKNIHSILTVNYILIKNKKAKLNRKLNFNNIIWYEYINQLEINEYICKDRKIRLVYNFI